MKTKIFLERKLWEKNDNNLTKKLENLLRSVGLWKRGFYRTYLILKKKKKSVFDFGSKHSIKISIFAYKKVLYNFFPRKSKDDRDIDPRIYLEVAEKEFLTYYKNQR